MSKLSLLRELFLFLMARKKWWLLPILLCLALLGLLFFISQTSPVAPFVYTLF